ncbi:hypothetical protein CR513_34473, partial [Mucuna pruriens]
MGIPRPCILAAPSKEANEANILLHPHTHMISLTISSKPHLFQLQTKDIRSRRIPLDDEEPLLELLELLELLLAWPPTSLSFSISTGGNILIGISSPISTSSSPASTFFGFFTSSSPPSTFSLADNSYQFNHTNSSKISIDIVNAKLHIVVIVAHQCLSLDLANHLLPIGDQSIKFPKGLCVNSLNVQLDLITILLQMPVPPPYDLHHLFHFLGWQTLQPKPQLVFLLKTHIPLVGILGLRLGLLQRLHGRGSHWGWSAHWRLQHRGGAEEALVAISEEGSDSPSSSPSLAQRGSTNWPAIPRQNHNHDPHNPRISHPSADTVPQTSALLNVNLTSEAKSEGVVYLFLERFDFTVPRSMVIVETHSDNIDGNIEDPPMFVFHELLQNLSATLHQVPNLRMRPFQILGGIRRQGSLVAGNLFAQRFLGMAVEGLAGL